MRNCNFDESFCRNDADMAMLIFFAVGFLAKIPWSWPFFTFFSETLWQMFLVFQFDEFGRGGKDSRLAGNYANPEREKIFKTRNEQFFGTSLGLPHYFVKARDRLFERHNRL